ncbi:MAG: YihY/virulence factor BrkB family protein [Sphingomonas bacterium]|nr:YihY/virulence factor BrkB family protein [Sphingomonas bacterium]
MGGIREPWRHSRADWWQGAKRAWARADEDNVSLIAAGVAFYAFAAIVPMLAAIVLTYGLVADAETVANDIRALATVLPSDAASVIGDQLQRVVETAQGSKGWGLILALGIALYGATKGTAAMVTALNIAFRVKEERGFVMLRIVALAMVVGAVILVITAMGTTTVLAFLTDLLPWTPDALLAAIRVGGYLLLALIAITGAAALYRFAPNHSDARWVWLSPGAVLSTLLWLAATALFGVYVSNFGSYGATYGSLSAVIVLLTWLWLSAYVFLLGGELNAALELKPDSVADGV